MKYSIIFLIIGISLIVAQEKRNPAINELINSHVDGCGCYFKKNAKSEKYIIEINDGYSAWMNIDGEDVELKYLKTVSSGIKFKVGAKYSQFYSNEKYSIEIQYTITKVHPDSEEWTDMSAYIIIKRDNNITKIKVVGGCGC